MRLLYLKYYSSNSEHPLNGFEQSFRSPSSLNAKINPLGLVGVNGSGKSKLLEVLAEIFIYLHDRFDDFLNISEKPSIKFTIKYALRIEGSWKFVEIKKPEQSSGIQVLTGSKIDELEEVSDSKTISNLLPTVVGYTSGENETLSNFFQPYQDDYAEYYQSSALSDKKTKSLPPLPHFVWLDFTMNKKVFLANSILSESSKWNTVKDEVKLIGIHSFRITIQLDPRGGPSIGIKPAPEQQAIIDKLKTCSTLRKEVEKTNKLVLDFHLNSETIKAFNKQFGSSYELYIALNQLDLLNHVLVRRQIDQARRVFRDTGENIKVAMPNDDDKAFNISHILVKSKRGETISYQDLSDGEHQFLHVFGSLLMVDRNNTLFLMDEPETHFNPQWRSAFISIMSKLVHRRYQEHLITTHSPFLLSDSKRENVLIFEKGRGGIKIKKPDFQTYGAAIDSLLHMAFGISPPVAVKSKTEIKKLSKDTDITREELEGKLSDFGDSIEKLALYQKLQELRIKESKGK